MTERPYEAVLFAERNRNRVYEVVVRALEDAAVPREEIARRIGKSDRHVRGLLSGPSKWTMDTVSDLLFAIGADMDYRVASNRDRDGAAE